MKVVRCKFSVTEGWANRDEAAALDSENTVVLVFCAPMYAEKPEVLRELKECFPKSMVAGCSTSGEIHGEEIHDESLSVAVIRFDGAKIRMTKQGIDSAEDSENVGAQIGETLAEQDLKAVIVLADGLQVNGSRLTKGLNKNLSENVVTAGGLAGDGSRFSSTWLVHEGEIVQSTVIGIGFYGEGLHVTNASRGGWDIFGPERIVTRSNGNVLFEIDKKPALDIYKEYLGEKAAELPSSGLFFPLQIRKDKADTNRLVRTCLAVSEEDKSITFAGDIPEGHLAQMMRANFERVIGAAGDAGETVSAELDAFDGHSDEAEVFTLAVSCVGRRLLLGDRAEEELEVLKSAIGDTAKVAGFYSYGEIGARVEGKTCDLHNQSMTVLSISEVVSEASSETSRETRRKVA